MARISIDLPETHVFTAEVPVRISDINYGGHVGNDTILSIIHDARVQFYRSLGYNNELNFEGSVGQIIADAALVYKSESFIGDILTVKISMGDFSKYGFDMYYLLENKTTGKEVARAKTGIVCFDYEKKKMASIPESLMKKIS